MYMHKSGFFGNLAEDIMWCAKALPQNTDLRNSEKIFGFTKNLPRLLKLNESKISVNGVRCTEYCTDKAPRNHTVLYLHGGGYVAGRTTMDYSAALLAKSLGKRVLMVDYSLAPEAPYPAALDDALTVYRWLIGTTECTDRITLFGDSAGGGLAVSLVIKLRELGLPMPDNLVLSAPWLDLRCISATYGSFTRDPVLNSTMLRTAAKQYSGKVGRKSPLVSPILAGVEDFPRTLVLCGTQDVLLGESIEFANKLSRAGVPHQFHLWKGMFHNFPITGFILKESVDARKIAKRFIEN